MQFLRWSRVLAAPIAALALLASASAASADISPNPVPCSSIGGGKYTCYFYPAGDGISGGAPVQAADGSTVGYLNQGNNWIICEAAGQRVTVGSTYNAWYAWTEANDGKWGWVNAVYARGGDNNGDFGGGVPVCGSANGAPPGGSTGAPPPPPPPPPPSGPAPVPCSAIGGGKYSCDWYVPGDGSSGGSPVLASNGSSVGYLHKGSNWILCQQAGGELNYGGFHNNNYGWTVADNGASGWVNAVYASGGDNDGPFQGVPACNGAHGAPPSGSAPAPPPPPPPSSGGGSACPDDTGPGDNVTRWNPVILCVLKLIGYSTSPGVVDDVDTIILHESSGNPTAINLTDSNAQAGHPSRGLIQVIPSTFEEHRCPSLPDDIVDPAANICAGLEYGIHKYGSIENIPGIVRVHNGGSYVGYFAHLSGPLTGCAQERSGGVLLNVSARQIGCASARRVAKTIDSSTAFRHALRHHHGGAGVKVRVRAHGTKFRCQASLDPHQGGALRAVACAAGKREVSWSATKR